MTLTVADATAGELPPLAEPGTSVDGPPLPATRGDAGIGALVAGATAFVAARPLADNSFLTHLATGRILLAEGFPTSNPFLYSSTAFPIPSWLWSGVLAGVDSLSGGAGVRLLTAALAGVLGFVVVRLTRPRASGGPRSLLSVILPSACVLITLMPFLNARPQLPGYLLLAATVLLVRERRSPWWLLPVFAVWVDVHGTWFYGLAVLALLVVADAIDDRRIGMRDLLCASAALLGVLVGGLVGPGRLRLVALPFEQLGDDRARRALAAYEEWRPAGFGHPLTWLLVAMGLVAVFGAVRDRRWGSTVGSLGMVAMGLSAGRLLPLAAITLVPWVASGLAGLGGMRLPGTRGVRALTAAGAALGVVAVAWSVLTPAYDLQRYPVAAVSWMERHGLAGRGDVKVLSHDYVGNYLDWRYGDRANTFVDDRPDVEASLDYATLLDLAPGWRDALRRADPDVVLWRRDEPLGGRLPASAWYDAGRFGDFSVYCRRSIADRCR